MTEPIPDDPALLLAVQMRPLVKHELWLDGRRVAVPAYQSGALTMLDLRTRPVANLSCSYECVQMFLPWSALDELCDAEGTRRFGDFPILNGATDPMLAHLAQIARAAVNPSGPATSLFVESMLLTVHRHLLSQYVGKPFSQSLVRGRLAQWQEMRVKEYIEAHLDTGVSVLQLAAQCNLSPSHFSRAFKASTGITPHRWLVERRIARARQLLLRSQKTIAEIAHLCGFSDQSHLAREFRRREGVGLREWRRHHQSGSASQVLI
jgi:AraC-like DNA-binding protein